MPTLSLSRMLPSLLLLVCVSLAPAGVVINELLAANATGLADEDGEYHDWFELYHSGDAPLHLVGYTLSDDPSRPTRWQLPTHTLEPGAYLIIWASGKHRAAPRLHTNFRLSSDGEYLGLFDPWGNVVDEVHFPGLPEDASFARVGDGGPTWHTTNHPTPGAANHWREAASMPLVSVPSGHYDQPISVEILSASADATIHYATGGRRPHAGSAVYRAALTLATNTVLRAVALREGAPPSRVATQTYLFDATGTLPALSLVADPMDLWAYADGILSHPLERGRAWERAAHMALLDGATTSPAIDCGLRVHGGASRLHSKNSFRLYFRESHGTQRLEYPLFGDTTVSSFKRLVLLAGSTDGVFAPNEIHGEVWTLLRNPLLGALFRQQGMLTPAVRPVRLYLNGAPWGIYWISERVDHAFMRDHTGLEDLDVIENQREVVMGDGLAWDATTSFFESTDLARPTNYPLVEQHIDLDNFITHYVLQMWAVNVDWPHNNVFTWRERAPHGRWRWIMWDGHGTLGSPSDNTPFYYMYAHMVGHHAQGEDWSTLHFRSMAGNHAFRQRFANRVADLLNTDLAADAVGEQVEALAAQLRDDIDFETRRWGGSPMQWEENVERLKAFVRERHERFLLNTMNYFRIVATVNLTVDASHGQGHVRLNSLHLRDLPFTGRYFYLHPVELAAQPAPGWRFERWVGHGSQQAEISVLLVQSATVDAEFKPMPGAALRLR